MVRVQLLRSQKNDVLKIIQDEGFSKDKFVWGITRSKYSYKDVPILKHSPTSYFFTFDRRDASFMVNASRVSSFSPGSENPREYTEYGSWSEALRCIRGWLRYVKRETEEPDLWDEDDYAKLNDSISDNSKFDEHELEEIKQGLDRVEMLLIEKSSKTEGVLEDISQKLNYLKSSAETIGRKDWLMMFIGTIVSNLVSWGIGNLAWQNAITVLLKGAKRLLGS